ncbi:MAG: ATP-grasp domain-containing protein [Candidatus Riflebacteria bacterium]|nr:ATP-grasp domain-containing protein [Candidatus Riflebacteria bacterium]
MQGLQVLVLYNMPAEAPVKGRPEDSISEAGVLAAVAAVRQALLALGARPSTYGVRSHVRGLLARLARQRPDLVFNLCEGIGGEASFEYLIPGLLELEGIPYTGSPAAALVVCGDKVRTKQLLAHHGLPTPAFRVVECGERPEGGPELAFPLFVKPAHEDASLGIDASSVVHDAAQLASRVASIHRLYLQPALVEQYVDGREFNLGVLGDGHSAAALPLAEIDFGGLPAGHPRIVSYEAKWVEDSPVYTGTPSVCPAPNVPPELAARIERVACRAFELMDCRGYARVDLRVTACGRPQILEVNPNPDLSPDAGLAKAARAAGLGYEGLVRAIAETGLRAFERPTRPAGETGVPAFGRIPEQPPTRGEAASNRTSR